MYNNLNDMMRKILSFVCAALLVAGLCGCEKIDVNKIDVNKLEGTWSEQYDPNIFAMDGSVEYTFDGNGHYQMHVYDALSGESHDYNGSHIQAREADIKGNGMAEGGYDLFSGDLGL